MSNAGAVNTWPAMRLSGKFTRNFRSLANNGGATLKASPFRNKGAAVVLVKVAVNVTVWPRDAVSSDEAKVIVRGAEKADPANSKSAGKARNNDDRKRMHILRFAI
jgi:hypothetical protein